jgi:hypothetical protein
MMRRVVQGVKSGVCDADPLEHALGIDGKLRWVYSGKNKSPNHLYLTDNCRNSSPQP